MLRDRLGEHATFLGWLEGDALADAYASADVFLFASRTDTFGQVLLEAQASGLPVVAVAEGGPCSIVEDGVTGRLCAPDADALADAVVALAADPEQRVRLAGAARAAVAERTWDRALERLADGLPARAGRRVRRRGRGGGRAVPPELAVLEGGASRAGSRFARAGAAPPRPLKVADVALFYGERSGGIRTYLDAKAEHALRHPGAIDHHILVPGAKERHEAGRHELPSMRVVAANGYRVPLGAGALKETLRELQPDVVLLHDPFWWPVDVISCARELGARTVAVHHGTSNLEAASLPGPSRVYAPLLRRWLRRSGRHVDAVMSNVDTMADFGRLATMPLRLGRPRGVPAAARRARAATMCCMSVGCRGRRACWSCWRPPPAAPIRGRCGSSGAGRWRRRSGPARAGSG